MKRKTAKSRLTRAYLLIRFEHGFKRVNRVIVHVQRPRKHLVSTTFKYKTVKSSRLFHPAIVHTSSPKKRNTILPGVKFQTCCSGSSDERANPFSVEIKINHALEKKKKGQPPQWRSRARGIIIPALRQSDKCTVLRLCRLFITHEESHRCRTLDKLDIHCKRGGSTPCLCNITFSLDSSRGGFDLQVRRAVAAACCIKAC